MLKRIGQAWLGVLVAIALLGQALAAPPPATAAGRFSEELVSFPNQENTLAGTLSLPAARGPHPAAILVSGSGQQDRDEAIPGLPNYRPFKWIADQLASNGIAVLRYDDRGVGGSTGDPSLATTADFATDAEAAIRYLLTRADVDPTQIGIIGHSEGGLIAAMVAARDQNVAFVVSLAGPGTNGYDLLLLQTERAARAAGLEEVAVAHLVDETRQVLDLTVAEDWPSLQALIEATLETQLAAMPEETRAALPSPEIIVAQQMTQLQGWLHFFVTYDPAMDWSQVRVPVLAVFGDLDVQVDAEQNRAPLEAALAEAGNPDLTVVVFPTANHLFQEAVTGGPDEYAQLPSEFAPGVLDTMTDWLLQRVSVREPMSGRFDRAASRRWAAQSRGSQVLGQEP